ncbi:DUF2283 domain-containing protein [Candidatus Micrarchaeota archaeon]|nr:DUF2283 domain-containing protein [Candidatus Micrarchaeota archaeon]
MKTLTYDPKADAAYAYGTEEKVNRTVEVNSDINVDFSAIGRVTGIEILNAKEVLSKALGARLNADEIRKIQYEIDETSGIFLHIRLDQKKASLVLPGKTVPA